MIFKVKRIKQNRARMTTMSRESMDEMVMSGLMEILVRRLSMVFGKEESEVRGAVGEELAGLEAGYKKWLSAMSMSSVSPKKAAKAPKEKEEKAPKAPKEPKEKAPKEPKAVGGKVVKAPKKEVIVVASEAPAVASEAPVVASEATVVASEAQVVSVEVKASPKAKKAVAPKEPKAVKEPKEPKAAKAKAAPKKKEVPVPVVPVVEEEEEEEVEVEEIEYEGVKYLRSNKGIVYDPETSEEVGRWNEEMSSIEVD